jgi:hypothetical protein
LFPALTALLPLNWRLLLSALSELLLYRQLLRKVMSCPGEAVADTGLAVDEVIIIVIIITLRIKEKHWTLLMFQI